MANRNYGERGEKDYEERGRWGGGREAGEEGRGIGSRDWGAGERTMGWGEEQGDRGSWGSQSGSGREDGSERGRGYWGEESRGGYGNWGGGYGGGRDRDVDWRSDWRGGREGQGGYGQGGYSQSQSGQGSYGSSQSSYGQGGYGASGGYGGGTQGGYGGQQDRQSWEGPHTGRGPKGYQRSNERIKEEVCETLTRHGSVDASGVTVEVNNGEVTLTGTVNSRQEKRMAEECIENLSGVKDVHNQLRISGSQGNGRGQEQSHETGITGGTGVTGTQDTGETGKSRSRR